ncbi:uncharacterized protein LOC141655713 [Silene latifolia]|uniref:uncharacterized protein LOC141655713 n=1 Tax=Silene latifolia TaxID=37657 RepID=UPI003D77FE19
MKRRLDTRFPAARIKKIMQSDDDVGKIAMAVPLLVSKALELFLQELCDRTYEITATRGAKTLSSLHLKQCVQRFNNFDFLRDILNKVPELEDSAARSDDRLTGRKRKLADYEDENGSNQHATAYTNVRVKGRGRGRGRGRGNRATKCDKFEDDFNMNDLQTSARKMSTCVRNFDLNLDLDENGNPVLVPTTGHSVEETVHEEHCSGSYREMETMENDPVMFSSSSEGTEDNEDYDAED